MRTYLPTNTSLLFLIIASISLQMRNMEWSLFKRFPASCKIKTLSGLIVISSFNSYIGPSHESRLFFSLTCHGPQGLNSQKAAQLREGYVVKEKYDVSNEGGQNAIIDYWLVVGAGHDPECSTIPIRFKAEVVPLLKVPKSMYNVVRLTKYKQTLKNILTIFFN